MTQPSLLSVVRTIITANSNLTNDEVIKRVRARGVKATDEAIKKSIYNVRSDLKKETPKPTPVSAGTTVAPAPSSAAVAAAAVDLSGVLSNVALVNAVVGACGGVEQARQAAEAVRACGSVDAFLQHLEIVAGIRTNE